MLKRIISFILILSFAASLPVFNTYFAAEAKITPLVYESFDDYASNSLPDKFSELGGVDARVVACDGSDKALYSKAWGGMDAGLELPISSQSTKIVMEADIMIDSAKSTGTLFALTDTAGADFVFATLGRDGAIHLGDGKRIGGYRLGVWQSFAYEIDLERSMLSLYIDGKRVLVNYKFSYSKFSSPKSVSFSLVAPESGEASELYLDNLKIYESEKRLDNSYFPYKGVSLESVDFTPTETAPKTGQLYLDFDCDAKGGAAINNAAGHPLEFIDDDTSPSGKVMRMARESGTELNNIQISIPSEAQSAGSYMTEIWVNIKKNTGSVSLMWLQDTNSKWLTNVSISANTFIFHGQRVYSFKSGEWTRVNVCYDNISKTYFAFVNGKRVGNEQKLPNGALKPTIMRVGLNDSGVSDVSFDSIKVYGGKKVLDFEEDKKEDKPTGDYKSILETKADAAKYIGNASVFMTEVDSLYFGGEKYSYSSLGFEPKWENGEFLVPASLIERVFGKKPDTEYVNLEKYCTGDLKLNVKYFDTGMYFISKNPISYTDSRVIMEIHEPIDVIYRYMQFERVGGEAAYEKLLEYSSGNKHPRLITEPKELEALRADVNSSTLRNSYLADILKTANVYLDRPPVERTELGTASSFLGSARESLLRIRNLSTAYQITGDELYAKKCLVEMENIMSWEDWNGDSTNYLDPSETSYALALGYDMLYDYLSDETKQKIIDNLFEKSLDWATSAYSGTHRRIDWVTSENPGNWSAVCNGGVLSACLAIVDDLEGDRLKQAKWLIGCAMQSMEYMTMLYFPDGAWIEGPAYWAYACNYLFGAIYAPLFYSCGTCFDLMEPKGIRDTLSYILYLQSPAGNAFNYGDGDNSPVKDSLGYLLALLDNDDKSMKLWRNILSDFKTTGDDKAFLWYREPQTSEGDAGEDELDPDRFFVSAGAGSMRQSWGNKDATFAGVKMGISHYAHGNMDLGSFVFDTLGERWAMELGADNYSLSTGYWGLNHFLAYKTRPEGQNVTVINPREDIEGEYYGGQYLDAYAPLTRQESKKRGAIMVTDLSEAYKYDTSKYTRGFMLSDERQTFTIQDEFTLLEDNSDILWFMHTGAEIIVDADGKGATLTQNGKSIRVDIDTNATSYHFEQREIAPLPTSPQIPDQLQGSYKPNGTKLTIVLKGSGDIYMTVKLSPVLEYEDFEKPKFTPISKWQIPDGEIPEKLRAYAIYADGKLIEGFDPDKVNYTLSVPYGKAIPVIYAESKTGSVSIEQSYDITRPSVVRVTDGNKTISYTITNESVASVTDDLISGMKGAVGLAPGMSIKNGVSATGSVVQESANGFGNVIDADLSTRWAASGYDQWVEIDLGAVYEISGVALGVYEGGGRQNIFKLMLSEDKMNYKTVFDGRSTGQTDGYESYVFDKPRRVRYIRYHGNQNNLNKWNSVTELAALVGGAAAPLQPTVPDKPKKEINGTVKVATVGDSLTQGLIGADGKYTKERAYANILSDYLGGKYEVKNFGRSSHGIYESHQYPYLKTEEYKNFLAYKPDVVLIMMGTNDAKTMYWDDIKGSYADMFRSFLASYKSLDSKPEIILGIPTPVFGNGDFAKDRPSDIMNEMRSIEMAVAKEMGISYINFAQLMQGRDSDFPDGLHFNENGAKTVAESFSKEIKSIYE